MFALIASWGKIPKYANTRLCQPHIIPQLLPMVCAKLLDCLALYKGLIFHIEVNKVFVFDAFPMEFNREIVFTSKRLDQSFFKNNLQCILVHVFVQKRT